MYKNLKFKHNLNKFIFITDKGSAMMLEKKQYWMTLLLAAVAFFILFIATYFISANGSKAATPMAGQVTEAKITSTLTAEQQLQITKILPSTKILLWLENDAKEDIERVFERFYRVDKSRSKAKKGTGLGLSIVKHGVQRLGGKIDIESQVGKGTKVTFEI